MHINQWRIQDFPEEGAPTLQEGGATYDFAKISQKLHEIERIWTPGGGGRGGASKILLCRSATANELVSRTLSDILLSLTKQRNKLTN